MNFPYMYNAEAMDSLEIDDIGNVYLNAFSDDGSEYYLSIKSYLGWVTIKEFGPLTADMNLVPNFYNFNYRRMEFNEKKINTTIDNFLNNPKRCITQVLEVQQEDVEERLANLRFADDDE